MLALLLYLESFNYDFLKMYLPPNYTIKVGIWPKSREVAGCTRYWQWLGLNVSYQNKWFTSITGDWFLFCLFWHRFEISIVLQREKKVFSSGELFWFLIYSLNSFYTVYNVSSIYVMFHKKKLFNAFICKICGKYSNYKSEI